MLTDSLTDARHTIIGDGLSKRFSDVGFVGTDENIHLLERYGLALHALNREEQRKTVFGDDFTEADLQAIINDVQTNHPEVARAEEAFQQFRKDFLQAWMVDTGFWTQEFFDHLNEMYPHYMPTFRIQEGRDGFGGRFTGAHANRYRLHEATGSSQDIYSPMYSFIGMVDQIVGMVNTNQAARAFDRLYQENAGMGLWARQIFDEGPAGHTPENNGELNARQQQLNDLLDGHISSDLMEQVLAVVQSQPGMNNDNAPGSLLTVQREDGTVVHYEMSDPYLYRLLSGVQATTGIQGLRAIGALTRTMSMLTTGSNPLFALRNAVRDFQTSVNYGTWATSYLDAIPKWMKTFAEVWRGDDIDTEYKAMGGGGWTYIDQNNAKSMGEITDTMFGENRGKTAKWLGKKVWDLVTLERVNEVIEQTSRQVEYRYGKHDRSTAEGRAEAFLAAQDVTVDFSRSGNSGLASAMKKLIPFFNASTQGVYRTGRQFTEEERSRAGIRAVKNIVNTALTSALSLGLILKFCDDEDKEEFANMLSDGIKANHLILPNPLANKDGSNGQPPFLRIPLAQDPLTYAVHNAVTNALWGGTMDETAIGLAATVDVVLDNLNPIGSGTIVQPFIDVSHNRTWYGGSIVRSSMEDWTDPASQYNEDTPGIFRLLGRLSNSSPEILEYLATQYTGFLGATMIPALTYNENGNVGGLDAVMQSIVKKWTADPLSSNDVTKYFYDIAADLNTIKEEATAERPQGLLSSSLTQDQVNEAYKEADAMLKTNGVIGATKKLISAAYKEIDRINANPTLSSNEKFKLTSDVKREMLQSVQAANEQLQGFQNKYMKGEGLIDRWFSNIHEGKLAHVPTDTEKMPDTFQKDAEEDYMKKAQEVYDSTGKSSALPHPLREFTINKTKYQIKDEDWDQCTEKYKEAYKLSLARISPRWNTMTEDEKSNALADAHKAGHEAMKKFYMLKNNIHK